MLAEFSQSKDFPFYLPERQISLNNFDFCNSKFFSRNSVIECKDLSQTSREVFQSWQVFKEQLRKTIKDAITRICLDDVGSSLCGRISPEILKNFWPENKLSPGKPSEEPLPAQKPDSPVEELQPSDFVNQRIIALLRFVERKLVSAEKPEEEPEPVAEKLRAEELRAMRLRQFSKTSSNGRMMSRSQYENNNPFIRAKKMDKRASQRASMNQRTSLFFRQEAPAEPLFGRECEQSLLYKQLIDEDKLENQNIQDFFKISRESLPQHLLLLFLAHVDVLLLVMGPRKSIEFILPIYFTILNMNSIYHSNFKGINLERKPVG